MKNEISVKPLCEKLHELTQAQHEYEVAKGVEREASIASTRALNRLNDLQKQVDKALAEIRSSSSGDWARRATHQEGS